MEGKLQSRIIKWLKDQGAYVVKPRSGPGVPVGCPDVIALYKMRWLVIEVKASKTSPFQVGQQATLRRLRNQNKFVYLACPENWETIKNDLSTNFF